MLRLYHAERPSHGAGPLTFTIFEMHKTHGLHVHRVTNRFIDVNKARELAQQAGWGRIHVKRMPAEHASYLAKYLSKGRRSAERLAAVGFLRRKAGTHESEGRGEGNAIQHDLPGLKEWQGMGACGVFFERMDFVRRMLFMTIEGGCLIR